jgi:hypothetical protein
MYVQGDLNIECENFNVMARAKTVINSAEGIEMRGARISMEAHLDNIDMAGRNVKMGASETISLTSVESTYISAQSQLNLRADSEVFVQGSDTHLLSSGTLYASGNEAQISAGVIYMDDEIRMAEGGSNPASPASPGIAPFLATLRDVEPRRPREPRSLDEREPVLVSQNYSSNYGVSPSAPDVTDDGEVIPTTRTT